MKVLLVCAQGMSTSLLASNMVRHGDPGDVVDSAAVAEVERVIDAYDVVLLAPQVRFQLAPIERVAAARGKPIGIMDAKAYGMLDGEAAMDQARALAS